MANDPFSQVLRNHDAEKIVLGSFMLHPERFLHLAGKVDARDFSTPKLRTLYEVLLEMYMAGEGMDMPVILQKAAARGVDAVTISECMDDGVGYRGQEWAIRNTRQMRERRDIQRAVYDLAGRLSDLDFDPYATLLDVALKRRDEAIRVFGPEEMADAQFSEMETRKRTGATHISGLCTGYDRLDYHLGGLEPDRISVVMGPTGHGKTKTVLNWLHTICVEGRTPGLFISAEMKPQDIIDRMTAIGSGEGFTYIKQGRTSQAVISAINAYHQGKLYISDNTPATVQHVALLIQKYAMLHGIKVWAYDYLSLLSRDNPKMKEDRDERYGRYVKVLRDMAVKTHTHGIIVSQVNRFDEIAESKKIMNDADHVMHFAHHKAANAHLLDLRKNRFGPSGYKYVINVDHKNHRMTEEGIARNE